MLLQHTVNLEILQLLHWIRIICNSDRLHRLGLLNNQ